MDQERQVPSPAEPSFTIVATASASSSNPVGQNAADPPPKVNSLKPDPSPLETDGKPEVPVAIAASPALAPGLDIQSFADRQAGPGATHSRGGLQTPPAPEVKAPLRDNCLRSAEPRRGRKLRFAATAAALVTVLGVGWLAGLNTDRFVDIAQNTSWLQQLGSNLKSGLASVQGEVLEKFEALAGRSVPVVRASQDAPAEKPNNAEVFEQVATNLSSKLDEMRASSEGVTQDLRIEVERLRGSAERGQGELVAKLDQLLGRVERLEHEAAAPSIKAVAQVPEQLTATPPIKPAPSPVQPARPVAEAKVMTSPGPTKAQPGTEPTLIKQWKVREVMNGMALLEGPRGLLGVSPGQVVPGVGRVESIARRGNGWVVATSKGVITAN